MILIPVKLRIIYGRLLGFNFYERNFIMQVNKSTKMITRRDFSLVTCYSFQATY